jgi:hypothetical protein
MGFLLDSCIIPGTVRSGVPFDIQIKYKLCTIETRNPDGNLQHFKGYDGIWWHYTNIIHTCIEYWVWKLTAMGLSFMENLPDHPSRGSLYENEIKVKQDGRSFISPGDEFTYTWHGTIEDLLGHELTTPTTVELGWSIFGYIYGWYEPSDWWPYDWNPPENFFDFSRVCWIKQSIQVLPPPPPFPAPIFKKDLCSVSKTTVSPSETFTITVAIENKNETSGSYSIGYYCEGNYGELGTGTIAGYETKTNITFNVTANQLAHREITESQYLSFSIIVSNAQEETDRWTPSAIAVIVTAPPPPTASLSGIVSDKKTGAKLAGVSVAIDSYSTSTNSSGYYAFQNLEAGSYTIKFSKSGYWEEKRSITITSGQNILDIAMTPTSEPPPIAPTEVPWAWLGIGALAIMALALIPKKEKVK